MQKRYVYFAKSLTYKLAEAHPDIKQLHRNISLTAITVTGEEAVICQFITPQKPPDFSYATISTTSSFSRVSFNSWRYDCNSCDVFVSFGRWRRAAL